MTIEIQCTSCHTRYRIDEQVLPEGVPTFKCSRCGHVFTFEPRPDGPVPAAKTTETAPGGVERKSTRSRPESPEDPDHIATAQASAAATEPGKVNDSAPAPAAPAAEEAPPAAAAGTDLEEKATAAPPKAPSTDELLARTITKAVDDAPSGENLKFDFSDDGPAADEPSFTGGAGTASSAADKWEVGDDATPDFEDHRSGPAARGEAGRKAGRRERPRGIDADSASALEINAAASFGRDVASSPDAPVYNTGITHSARFFLGLFILVAAVFGLAALAIHNAPAAADEILSRLPGVGLHFTPPTMPASLVALSDVHADYHQLKNGHTALVITGVAENVGTDPLHIVQIAVTLRDSSERAAASKTVYCGNNLEVNMVAQMTPHELDFFQNLGPPKSFNLPANATSPFVLVFIDPPAVARFEISVAKALAAPAGTPSA